MERIILPEDDIRERRPVHIEFRPDSFPGQTFRVRMDYNEVGEFWTVEIEHVEVDRIVTSSVAVPYRVYGYLPWLGFIFADKTGETHELTPQTLGYDIDLWVLPGPDGKQDFVDD